jgi:hypothetical protein
MFNKPVSSLLIAEDINGANFHMPVPHLDVRNPVPKTAHIMEGPEYHLPIDKHLPYKDKNHDGFPDPVKSTKPHKTRVPRTYW